jgi:hypothetical protein
VKPLVEGDMGSRHAAGVCRNRPHRW